jgi:D-threo-aldose 1-dehydrogenase
LRSYLKSRADTSQHARRYDAVAARIGLETSLRELRTDYVDIFFLHDPSLGDVVDLDGTCSYLEDAKQAGYLRSWGVAGEAAPCMEIKRRLAPPAVLQMRRDIFHAPGRDATPLEQSITFGILAEALAWIVAHVAGSAERRARWMRAVGVDCTSADAVAALLMRDALASNRDGVVLFSTTKPERLQALRGLVDGSLADDSMLTAFRERVTDELIAPPTIRNPRDAP